MKLKLLPVIVGIGALVGAVAFLDHHANPKREASRAFESSTVSGNANAEARVDKRSDPVEMIISARRTVAGSYAALSEAASAGSGDAAYQLYQDMLRCSLIKERTEALESNAASGTDKQIIDAMVKQIADDESACQGVSNEQKAEKADWAIRAARLGNTEAQLLFFGAATERFDTPEKVVANVDEIGKLKAEAIRHLQSAARKGNDTALFNLAMAESKGTLTNRNPVAAYGYMLALRNRGGSAASDRFLNQWAREMSPDQIAKAQAFAKQISVNERSR